MSSRFPLTVNTSTQSIEELPANVELDLTSSNIANVPLVDFDTAANQTAAEGELTWNDGEGTLDVGLKGDNVTLNVGTQEYARVYNAEATTLNKGEVVYIFGAQGNRISVKRAQANTEATSFGTLGFVAETIAAGAEGYVTVSGALYKLNTDGLTAGQAVYLSPTVAGGYTTTKPVAPNQLVVLGWIERVSTTVGSIYVKVDNGYELDELHDVLITSPVAGQGLVYSSSNLWVNGNVNYANNSGNATTANTAGTVTTNAQPNITSVGTLTSLSVNGISTLGPNGNVKITGGSSGQLLQTDGTGNLSWATFSSNAITNGTSNVNIPTTNGNISMSVDGVSNVVVVSNSTMTVSNLRVSNNTIILGRNANGLSNSSQIVIGDGANAVLNVNNGSIAIGNDAQTVSTDRGIAIGASSRSRGFGIAAGDGANADGTWGTAIGSGARAGGTSSVAVGRLVFSSGSTSVVIGQDNSNASGGSAIAIGTTTVAAGDHSVAISSSAFANSANAIAIGRSAQATAIDTVAIGQNARARFANAIAIGDTANASANSSIVLNATGSELVTTTANSFNVKPIRQASTGNILYYDNTSGEISFQSTSNITSVGTLTNLSVSGNVTATNFIGNGSQLTGITVGTKALLAAYRGGTPVAVNVSNSTWFFTSVISNTGGIEYDTATGNLTLPGNKTYRISVNSSRFTAPTGTGPASMTFGWCETNSNTQISSMGSGTIGLDQIGGSGGTTTFGSGTIEIIYAPSVTGNIRLATLVGSDAEFKWAASSLLVQEL